jgi:hypothetical protein
MASESFSSSPIRDWANACGASAQEFESTPMITKTLAVASEPLVILVFLVVKS